MPFSDKIKNIFKKATGLTLYKKLPFGIDEMEDIKYRFNGYSFTTFFDVGANVGQSASHIRSHFPGVAIHSFEPFSTTFKQLVLNTAHKNVNCHNMALGASEETIQVKQSANTEYSDRNSLLQANDPGSGNVGLENITVRRLDNFCLEHKIDFIDFLKIDTEGYDLEVLKGAEILLQNQSVAFIEAEVGMNAYNTLHVDYETVRKFLEAYDYLVFGIYEQVQEWNPLQPVLRRSNALFISKKLADQFTGR